MTDQEINVAIAESLGAKRSMEKAHPHRYVWDFGDGVSLCCCDLPDYCNDLNAMHEAAMHIRCESPIKYIHFSAEITSLVAKWNSDLESEFSISAHDATARQRAEAYLRTIGKWKD